MSPRIACALLALTEGCAWSCAAPSPQVISPTIDTVACILSTYAKDEAAGEPATSIVADVVATCGTDAATVLTVWGAHVHAAIIDPSPKVMPILDGGK